MIEDIASFLGKRCCIIGDTTTIKREILYSLLIREPVIAWRRRQKALDIEAKIPGQ
jgi:hypothetical protein